MSLVLTKAAYIWLKIVTNIKLLNIIIILKCFLLQCILKCHLFLWWQCWFFFTFITPAFRVFLLLSMLKCVVPFNAYWLYKTTFPSKKKRSYWSQTLNSSVCICLSLSIRCHQAVWDLDVSWQRTSVLRVWNYYHAIQACFQNSVWQSIWIQTHYLSHTHIRKAPRPRFYFQHMYQSRHCLNINTWEMRKKLIWNM